MGAGGVPLGPGGIEREEESPGWHRLRTVTSGWDSDDDDDVGNKDTRKTGTRDDLRQKLKVRDRERDRSMH